MKEFYSTGDYTKWWESMPQRDQRKWRIKYYKVLGTSSAAEAKEYFGSLDKSVRMFTHDGLVSLSRATPLILFVYPHH
jgi:DNA topoisomerase-2